MSDGMAFLTGAAVAGVAVLFMMRGGEGLGLTNLPSSQPAPISPANPYAPYNPYGTALPSPTPTAPGFLPNDPNQQMTVDRLKTMLEQQRNETEQLKAQLQKQQAVIENLTGQSNSDLMPQDIAAAPPPTPTQQQDNSILSGIVWGIAGMAVTISGGLVVVGMLAVLSRQQRQPSRTTYVVPQPYTALPPQSLHPRRRAEVIPPHLDERQVDYIEYER
ncbi:MAG TPA: hypothetical protein DDZ80_16635 [Cyanobacteria bacterium UBA8803]|nr:hypothetical protein [Cyanobacteria bacterium UBA9273]HBL60031.1 hypothetical protein [Cyanobacteria bacterium UBA8803]